MGKTNYCSNRGKYTPIKTGRVSLHIHTQADLILSNETLASKNKVQRALRTTQTLGHNTEDI